MGKKIDVGNGKYLDEETGEFVDQSVSPSFSLPQNNSQTIKPTNTPKPYLIITAIMLIVVTIGVIIYANSNDNKESVNTGYNKDHTHKPQPSKAQPPENDDTFTDPRDGQSYRTVKIGNLIWMAQNLNYAHPKKGTNWCYGGDTSNCEKYGRLYNWDAARSVCPDKWHLPTLDDWNSLVSVADGNIASLKTKDGWNNNGIGTDDLGFSALPGGKRHNDGEFDEVDYIGNWWTINEDKNDKVYCWYMSSDMGEAKCRKNIGLSVRCVKER